jgi:hypothetical protein
VAAGLNVRVDVELRTPTQVSLPVPLSSEVVIESETSIMRIPVMALVLSDEDWERQQGQTALQGRMSGIERTRSQLSRSSMQ